jgi:CheY-like chemotaxis protein
VLVVEDDVIFAQILYDLAHELNYNCLVAHNALDGLALATQFLPNAILLDMGLPDSPGLALLQQIKDNPQTRKIPVHVVSGDESSAPAMEMGAIGYAIKPTSREQLKEVFSALEGALQQKVRRVLLVESDEAQRISIEQLIGEHDVVITSAATGEKALALLTETTFDCMVVDLELPGSQSYALVKRMGAQDAASFPPVILYTDRDLTREEEGELLKFSRSIIIKGERSLERLLDEVTLFLHKVQTDLSAPRKALTAATPASAHRDRIFDGRKVLLVDDDVRNVFALTSVLEKKGMKVVVGRDGFDALEKLDQMHDIDLVLMDIMMPGMDGLEATRRIRQVPRLATLAIIAVTAKAMKDDQEQCLRAGANDYLAKPIDLDRLFSLLRVWMPKLETV